MNVVIVNYKAYDAATGNNALKLTKILEKCTHDIKLMVAVSNIDIHKVATSTKVKVLAQHLDNLDFGKGTGKTVAKAIKENKAAGVLMNHAEDKLELKDIEENIKRCRELKLISVVCCAKLSEAKKIIEFKPDYLAYEVPELIGTGKSISKASPGLIQQFVKIVGTNSIPLCGAGVTTNDDYKAAIKLGTKGVLLASGITKADNPGKAMKEMLKE